MSWLGGNDRTTLWTDLSSLWRNATTGDLTSDQVAEINHSTVEDLNSCNVNIGGVWSEKCQDIYNNNSEDISQLGIGNSNCALRLSDSFCFESWNSVAFVAFAIVIGVILLKTAIESYPAYARARA